MHRSALALLLATRGLLAVEPLVVNLWPGTPPGTTSRGPERDATKHDPKAAPGTDVVRLTDIVLPTLTVYRPEADKANGTAVLVAPGGGYSILAWDKEGSEICTWLNSLGVTGLLLKYRVPGHLTAKHREPLMDAQRGLSLARARAAEWGLAPTRIGMLGFSAGGHLTAMASTNYDTRAYEPVDDADKLSCRPDFSVLVYPAWLTRVTDHSQLVAELKVTAQTPPAFCVQTVDDPLHAESVLAYAAALAAVKVPYELHIYPFGGHGYGLRPSPRPVSRWHERAGEWMAQMGWLDKPK